ncbi:MAG: hypothetical protein A2104_09950 [Candidatus Melainabacteria bacterium GWF2_32_7]|nr:MAG: hypothetical protein A2104_09950 [Candidatus Melainabacteria bacterium GWF2_32_7]
MRKSSGYTRGQHLVEFALILPIIVIILLILIEYGYAIVARNTLAEAVKMCIPKLSEIAYMPGDETSKVTRIENELTLNLQNYFKTHNMMYDGTLEVNIVKDLVSQVSIINVTYRYFPAFTLPRILTGDIIPNEIVLHSAQAVNTSLLVPNTYWAYLKTDDLYVFNESTSILDSDAKFVTSQ